MLSHYEGPFYPLGRGAWATAARESSGWAAHASGIRTLTLTLTLTLILTLNLTPTLTPTLTRRVPVHELPDAQRPRDARESQG